MQPGVREREEGIRVAGAPQQGEGRGRAAGDGVGRVGEGGEEGGFGGVEEVLHSELVILRGGGVSFSLFSGTGKWFSRLGRIRLGWKKGKVGGFPCVIREGDDEREWLGDWKTSA